MRVYKGQNWLISSEYQIKNVVTNTVQGDLTQDGNHPGK